MVNFTLFHAIAFLIAVVIHEYAHARVAYKWGDTTAYNKGRMTLNPVEHLDIIGLISFFVTGFGWAKPVPINYDYFLQIGQRAAFISVALAGIAANFALGVISILMANSGLFAGALEQFWVVMSLVNISFALFNLVPIPPLDGGQVLVEFLKDREPEVVNFLKKWGWVILFFLGLSGILHTMYIAVRRYLVALLLGNIKITISGR